MRDDRPKRRAKEVTKLNETGGETALKNQQHFGSRLGVVASVGLLIPQLGFLCIYGAASSGLALVVAT